MADPAAVPVSDEQIMRLVCTHFHGDTRRRLLRTEWKDGIDTDSPTQSLRAFVDALYAIAPAREPNSAMKWAGTKALESYTKPGLVAAIECWRAMYDAALCSKHDTTIERPNPAGHT